MACGGAGFAACGVGGELLACEGECGAGECVRLRCCGGGHRVEVGGGEECGREAGWILDGWMWEVVRFFEIVLRVLVLVSGR